MKYIRIGVTGGRDYADSARVYQVLNLVKKSIEVLGAKMFLVVGDARGLDEIARQWASTELPEGDWKEFKADWDNFGNRAGPLRNIHMLHSGIDVLYAFPGGKGTAHMTKICKDAGVHVKEIT